MVEFTRNKVLAIALVVTLLGVSFAFVWGYNDIRSGIWIEGDLWIETESGVQTYSWAEGDPADAVRFIVQKASVLTQGGDTIKSLGYKVWLKWRIEGAEQLAFQWASLSSFQFHSTYSKGARSYSGLFGFIDLFYEDNWGIKDSNRWVHIANGLSVGAVRNALSKFYRERGSGLQVGEWNIGVEFAKVIIDATKGLPIADQLGEKLTTLFAVDVHKNQDKVLLGEWEMQGIELWTCLKRIQWGIGLALHADVGGCQSLFAFSVGIGEFMRLHDGDELNIKVWVHVFYRWQDLDGTWTSWTTKNVQIGRTVELKVGEGTWASGSIEVGF